MKKIHIALSTDKIGETVKDYSKRLACEPCLVIPDQYALWRTEFINMSIRQDDTCKPGQLRHLGWEDSEADVFTSETDVNGILWEKFSAKNQADEIEQTWPGTGYKYK
ncbi:MAG: hypothetical protein HND53_01580 [Proteobacteria bacterium]|nr:hypothetical protein [Pseudomonadota bacterium]NOG59162.1 hypothetical protein [Pseudomonadota bacterium]